jgi:hypothetical protein
MPVKFFTMGKGGCIFISHSLPGSGRDRAIPSNGSNKNKEKKEERMEDPEEEEDIRRRISLGPLCLSAPQQSHAEPSSSPPFQFFFSFLISPPFVDTSKLRGPPFLLGRKMKINFPHSF